MKHYRRYKGVYEGLDLKKTPAAPRPAGWAPLDMDELEREFELDSYEKKMVNAQCPDMDSARKALRAKRSADELYRDVIISADQEATREQFFRKSVNDLEEDSYERQEVTCLNG